MIEMVKNCYCDILSEHNGQKIPGAKRYKNVDVMVVDDDGITYHIEPKDLDLCPECRKKFSTNLFATYDVRGQIIYSLGSAPTV